MTQAPTVSFELTLPDMKAAQRAMRRHDKVLRGARIVAIILFDWREPSLFPNRRAFDSG